MPLHELRGKRDNRVRDDFCCPITFVINATVFVLPGEQSGSRAHRGD